MPYESNQREAFSVLTNGRMARALAIEDEPEMVRDRYGRHQFGQTILLARRLIGAGVCSITNRGRVQSKRLARRNQVQEQTV